MLRYERWVTAGQDSPVPTIIVVPATDRECFGLEISLFQPTGQASASKTAESSRTVLRSHESEILDKFIAAKSRVTTLR